MEAVAGALWYPIWNAKLALDHSVRTQGDALAVASTDVKAALSLLDARLVAGDGAMVAQLHGEVLAQWRREAPRGLVALRELTETETIGEAAAISTCNRTELYLVVSDPVQAGTMAVMAVADTATFDLERQRGRRY